MRVRSFTPTALCWRLPCRAAAGLRGLERDSSVDAFVPATHPAAEARDRARALFGLDDPVIIGLQTPPGVSVWEPAVLTALREIHDQARRLPGVIKADVRSLASERLMHGDGGDLLVDPLLPDGPVTAATAAQPTAAAAIFVAPTLSPITR